MTDLIPINESGGLSRDARRAGRAISRTRSYTQMRLAGIDSETDVAIDKIEAVSVATGAGIAAVTRVAAAAKHCEMQHPDASGRIAMLADAHALMVNDLLHDLRRDLRRR